MKISEEQFALMMQNKNLKVATNSATRGAVSSFESSEAPEAKKRSSSIKVKTKPNVTPHAQSLAYLSSHPENLQGRQEHYCQVTIFDWLEKFHPDIYEMTAAIPNAGKRAGGQGQAMIAEGLKAGYPDITIDVAKGAYHGFRLELKMGKNNCSESQTEYHKRLRRHGYAVVVCWELDAAMKAILEYWSLEESGSMSQEEYK